MPTNGLDRDLRSNFSESLPAALYDTVLTYLLDTVPCLQGALPISSLRAKDPAVAKWVINLLQLWNEASRSFFAMWH